MPGSGIAALEGRLVRLVLNTDYAEHVLKELPVGLRGRTTHVGRTEQLDDCEAAIVSESISFVLIQGPAGIGKSRFSQAAAERVCGFGIAVVDTWVEENPSPSQPIEELLRRYVTSGSVPTPEFLETVLSTLVEFAESRRLLVVFEDLHNADLSTVKTLCRIMRRDPIEGVTFLFTARDSGASPF